VGALAEHEITRQQAVSQLVFILEHAVSQLVFILEHAGC
jgi:hypothetical protein